MEQAEWEDLVRQAALAPSSINTQPWLFVVREGVLELHADRTRALPENDPDDRELTISCGAALFNLRVAATAAGYRAEVAQVPADSVPDLLARVTLTPGSSDDPADLAAAIPVRHTSREPFAAESVPGSVRVRLGAATAAEGATLHWLDGKQLREQVADLVAEGDRIQFADKRWRRERAMWMHPSRADDGLAVEHFGSAVRFVVSRFNVGNSTAGKDEVFALRAPALAVFSTPGDDSDDWIAAGQALERTLLVAAAEGIQAGYLNQPCQLPDLRPRLAELGGIAGVPQLLLRFGRPLGEPPPHRRRPVGDILGFA